VICLNILFLKLTIHGEDLFPEVEDICLQLSLKAYIHVCGKRVLFFTVVHLVQL